MATQKRKTIKKIDKTTETYSSPSVQKKPMSRGLKYGLAFIGVIIVLSILVYVHHSYDSTIAQDNYYSGLSNLCTNSSYIAVNSSIVSGNLDFGTEINLPDQCSGVTVNLFINGQDVATGLGGVSFTFPITMPQTFFIHYSEQSGSPFVWEVNSTLSVPISIDQNGNIV